VRCWARDILVGLYVLKGHGFDHGRLALETCLIDEEGRLSLIGGGLPTIMRERSREILKYRADAQAYYRPPEHGTLFAVELNQGFSGVTSSLFSIPKPKPKLQSRRGRPLCTRRHHVPAHLRRATIRREESRQREIGDRGSRDDSEPEARGEIDDCADGRGR